MDTEQTGSGDEVHVWWFHLDDPRLDRVTPTSAERERAGRSLPKVGQRFLRHRAAVRITLGTHAGTDPERLRFSRACRHCGDPHHGKPSVRAPPLARPWRFSASRAGDTAIVAVAHEREVGVDIEAQDRVHDPNALRDTVLGPTERTWWDQQTDPATAFLLLWVRKEAYLKLGGHGIVTSLPAVDTTRWIDPRIPADPDACPHGARFVDLGAPEGMAACLVVAGDAPFSVVVHTYPDPARS